MRQCSNRQLRGGFDGQPNQCPVVDHPELAPKRRNVRFHGAGRDEETVADLTMGEVLADKIEDLRLAGRHHDATATRSTVHAPSIAPLPKIGIRGSPGCARAGRAAS